jgi:hypothetical protein
MASVKIAFAYWASIKLPEAISAPAETGFIVAHASWIAFLNALIVVKSDEICLVILMYSESHVVPPLCLTDIIARVSLGPYARFATCSASRGRSEGESRLIDLVH